MLEYGPVKRALALNWTGRWSVQETAFHAGALERLAMKFAGIDGLTTRVVWIDTGTVIKLIPIPEDPITALRGCSTGEHLSASLLIDRKEDGQRENGSFSA